jgi:hypothetical protein
LRLGHTLCGFEEGTVIVDGMAASCFSVVASHELARLFFSPAVLLHRLAGGKDLLSSDRSIAGENALHWAVKASFNGGRAFFPKAFFHSAAPGWMM